MISITDDYMKEMLPKVRPYTLVILHKTSKVSELGADKIVWEHGRRNFGLMSEKKLHVVGPVRDESNVCGAYIFSTSTSETKELMDQDPGVKSGIFTYEIHQMQSFPGSTLP